jgi:hypothetical protein
MIHSPQSAFDPPSDEQTALTSASRALVPVARAASIRRNATVRASAPFLAQLIATAQQTPQTREKRRAEPEAAILAYRTASTRQ